MEARIDRTDWVENPKLIYHPAWLRRFRKDPFSVPPIYLEVSPVGMCNHRCTFCAPEMLGYPNRSLSLEVMKRFLAELEDMRMRDPDNLGVRSIQYAGEGEPTLHPELAEIFEATRSAGIDIGMLTNATGLTRKLSEKIVPLVNGYIQVSINAGTRESYALIHQTKESHWDLIWRNIVAAVRVREKHCANECDIGANITLLIEETTDASGRRVPSNWNEVPELVKRARDAGMDYVAIKPYSQHPFSKETAKRYGGMSYQDVLSQIDETCGRLKEEYNTENFEVVYRESRFREYEEKTRTYSVCRATPTVWSYIQSDGLWLSCSAFWTDSRFALGNIYTQSVKDIWFGEMRREHCSFITHELDISECRKTCHPDKENRFLDELATLSDANFEETMSRLKDIPAPKRKNFI